MIHASVMGVAAVAIGCAAPPIGLGSGALRPAHPRTGTSATGAAGFGGGHDRTVFQIDGALAVAVHPAFTMEGGLVYTQLSQPTAAGELIAHGGFPYLRPRLTLGPVSIAIALAGFAIGGGEGGVIAGIADAQVGYGREAWAIYAGGYALHHEVLGSSTTSARQLRLGGEYLMTTPGGRVGVALELYRQDDTLRAIGAGRDRMAASRFFGGAIKLRFASTRWRL
jgi:hypothetical protein